jgi:anti-sigma regulatory factor (Ser/Thr protein kinase)
MSATLSLAGFPELAQWAFATAASKVASNALKRGREGAMHLRFFQEEGGCLEFEVVEKGPGFSTREDEDCAVRPGGFGNGPSTLSRLIDTLSVTSASGQDD